MIFAFHLLTLVAAQVSDADPSIYAEPPTTLKGCECKGECTTSLAFECNAQPFCIVKDKKCANGDAEYSFSKGGYYDYCTWQKYQPYESLTAAQKSSLLLKNINEDTEPGKYPSTVGVLTGIMGESVSVSFDAQSDVFPQTRTKFIHSVGVVAPISFKSTGDHKYTGLFTGADYGFVRLSSANCPGSNGNVFTPGAGIKLLRDGKPSANFVAMYSLDGQPCENGTSNFFGNTWTNHIPSTDNFGLKLIAAKFWQASNCPLMVGLSDVAANDDGSEAVFPFELALKPAVSLDFPCDDLSTGLANFGKLEVGKTLFTIEATDSPGGSKKVIGEFVLTAPATTSKFGDEEMFFKHQYMEEDFALRPAWLNAIDPKKDCGMSSMSTTPPATSQGCHNPFRFSDW